MDAATDQYTVAHVISLKDEGNKAFKSGDVKLAHDLYTDALHKLDGRDQDLAATLYSNRAATSLKFLDYQKCIDDCGEALRVAPENVKALYRRAQAEIAIGDRHRAFEDLMRVIKIDPKNSEALVSLRVVKEAIDKDRASMTEVRKILKALSTTNECTTDNMKALISRISDDKFHAMDFARSGGIGWIGAFLEQREVSSSLSSTSPPEQQINISNNVNKNEELSLALRILSEAASYSDFVLSSVDISPKQSSSSSTILLIPRPAHDTVFVDESGKLKFNALCSLLLHTNKDVFHSASVLIMRILKALPLEDKEVHSGGSGGGGSGGSGGSSDGSTTTEGSRQEQQQLQQQQQDKSKQLQQHRLYLKEAQVKTVLASLLAPLCGSINSSSNSPSSSIDTESDSGYQRFSLTVDSIAALFSCSADYHQSGAADPIVDTRTESNEQRRFRQDQTRLLKHRATQHASWAMECGLVDTLVRFLDDQNVMVRQQAAVCIGQLAVAIDDDDRIKQAVRKYLGGSRGTEKEEGGGAAERRLGGGNVVGGKISEDSGRPRVEELSTTVEEDEEETAAATLSPPSSTAKEPAALAPSTPIAPSVSAASAASAAAKSSITPLLPSTSSSSSSNNRKEEEEKKLSKCEDDDVPVSLSQCRSQAALTIALLTAKPELGTWALQLPGGVQQLILLISTGEPRCQELAAEAICIAASTDSGASLLSSIITSGAMEPLLKSHMQSIRTAAASTIAKLSIKAKALKEDSEEMAMILNTALTVIKSNSSAAAGKEAAAATVAATVTAAGGSGSSGSGVSSYSSSSSASAIINTNKKKKEGVNASPSSSSSAPAVVPVASALAATSKSLQVNLRRVESIVSVERAIEMLASMVGRTHIKEELIHGSFRVATSSLASLIDVEIDDTRSTAAYGLAHILSCLTVTNYELKAKALAEKEITVEQYDKLQELQRIKPKDDLEAKMFDEKLDGSDPDTVAMCKIRIQRIAAVNGIKLLVKLLAEGSAQTKETAARTFRQMNVEESVRGLMIQQGALKALIAAASDDTNLATTRREAAHAVAKILVTTNPHVLSEHLRVTSITPLLHLCKDVDASNLQQFESLLSLTNLVSCGYTEQDKLAAEKGVSAVHYLMCCDHPMVKRAAVEVFCNMAMHPAVMKLLRSADQVRLWIVLLEQGIRAPDDDIEEDEHEEKDKEEVEEKEEGEKSSSYNRRRGISGGGDEADPNDPDTQAYLTCRAALGTLAVATADEGVCRALLTSASSSPPQAASSKGSRDAGKDRPDASTTPLLLPAAVVSASKEATTTATTTINNKAAEDGTKVSSEDYFPGLLVLLSKNLEKPELVHRALVIILNLLTATSEEDCEPGSIQSSAVEIVKDSDSIPVLAATRLCKAGMIPVLGVLLTACNDGGAISQLAAQVAQELQKLVEDS